ncbi:MAG TPA: hypothetical protein VLM38_23420 [Blastocatellia bacterium]|nr:hypothetical protein [Blastocatellia bacterium]
MKPIRALVMVFVSVAVTAAATPVTICRSFAMGGASEARPFEALAAGVAPAIDCPQIFPDGPVAVAPNQPAVPFQSMVGVINALCDVTLDFVGCGFTPTSITLNCDSNGDGVPEILIPLDHITVINRLLLQATLPSLATTPGTAFPLACCGGAATITMTRVWNASDDNVFGPFTQSITCPVDLGIRAPVVISASPSEGDCALGQNLLIPGSCFLLADGKPNVTSVFGVEVGNPANVIQASAFQILNGNIIDALFKPGPANAGKTFLIFVSGPNGTSRNLTALPPNAEAGCPLGNEQGIQVTFKCRSNSSSGGPGPGEGSTPSGPLVAGCRVDRDDAGSFSLSIFGRGIRGGATLTIGGVTPKKIKFRDADADGTFTRITVKKKFCASLPGAILVTNPDGGSSAPLVCADRCLTQ